MSISFMRHQSLQRQLFVWIIASMLCVAILAGGFALFKTYHDLNHLQRNNLKNIAMLFASAPPPKPRLRLLRKRLQDKNYSPQQIDAFMNLPEAEQQQALRHHFDKARNHRPKPAVDINSSANEEKVINQKLFDNQDLSHDNNIQEEISQYDSKTDGEIRVHIIPLPLERLNTEDLQRIQQQKLLNLPLGFGHFNNQESNEQKENWQTYRIDQPQRIIIVRQKTSLQQKLAVSGALQAFLPMLMAILVLMSILPLLLNKMFRPVRELSRQVASRDEQDLSAIILENKHKKTQIPQELQPLVKELNQLLTRLSEYIVRQRRFIADASHELRSPLTAISLQVQRLQKLANNTDANRSLSEEQRMERLQQGINKLEIRVSHNQHLVEQLLTLARIEAGKMQSAHTDLMPVLTQVMILLLPLADNKLIELAVDNQLENTTQQTLIEHVKLDDTSLMMLLKNLIQNAILYTPNNGQVSVSILDTLTFQQSHQALTNQPRFVPIIDNNHTHLFSNPTDNKGRLVVQIKDTGIGMPEDAYKQAFTPFVRISHQHQNNHVYKDGHSSDTAPSHHTDNTVQGTGLGLAIVYQICQEAGIDLYLSASSDREKNRGLTVTLVF